MTKNTTAESVSVTEVNAALLLQALNKIGPKKLADKGRVAWLRRASRLAGKLDELRASDAELDADAKRMARHARAFYRLLDHVEKPLATSAPLNYARLRAHARLSRKMVDCARERMLDLDEHDFDNISMMLEDASNMLSIAVALQDGNLKRARKICEGIDTEPREAIDAEVWKALFDDEN